jgi:hypothetical protein
MQIPPIAQGSRAQQELRLTNHAAVRLQQRGIPPWFMQLLLEHGSTEHDGHGALIKSVTKATRQRLARVLDRKQYAQAERWFGVYAVISTDSAVVTAAHRTQRRYH